MLKPIPAARSPRQACKEVGLSEAALYRHFPSKAKMIEGLIEFIEETLFSRMAAIAKSLAIMRASAMTSYCLS